MIRDRINKNMYVYVQAEHNYYDFDNFAFEYILLYNLALDLKRERDYFFTPFLETRSLYTSTSIHIIFCESFSYPCSI